MLNIGDMSFANVYPLVHFLKKRDDLRFVSGVPSFLNTALREGGVDVSPSSSIEYARFPERYYILPDLSISSIGEVKSVVLFSQLPMEQLHERRIALTSESNTSVVLLRILLERFSGVSSRYVPHNEEADAKLLIGDSALKEYYADTAPFRYDLGEWWMRVTGLPFVFALWIARKDADRHELIRFANDLLAIKTGEATNHQALLDAYELKGFTREQMHDYWHTINYDLSEKHVAGLRLFYRYASEMGECPSVPDLDFLVI